MARKKTAAVVLVTLAVATTVSLAVRLALQSQRRPPPNVVIVSIDTLRADHTSVYGYQRPTTPRLEGFARHGVRFARAYATSASTAPSHASLFTGLYPLAHGLERNARTLSPQVPLLAERLRAAGYQTAAVVSSFVLDAKFGLARGFDTYMDDFTREDSKYAVNAWEGHRIHGGFDSRAEATSNRAIDWLTHSRTAERPFFLFVHYFDPHEPYRAPEPYGERFVPVTEGLGEVAGRAARYDGEIAYCDHHVGRFLDALDQVAPADQTLVIITADHGQGLMDHGEPFHGVFIYEEDVRIPLLLRWTGRLKAGRVIESRVSLVDVVPTLVDQLGLADPDARLDGRSLRGLLEGVSASSSRDILMQRARFEAPRNVRGHILRGRQLGLLRGKWKYILSAQQNTRELYNLEQDPDERHNLVGQVPDVASQLHESVDRWLRTAQTPPQTPIQLSDQDLARLRALGYVN